MDTQRAPGERAERVISEIAEHRALIVEQLLELVPGLAPQSMRRILRTYRRAGVLEREWLPTSPPTGFWYLSARAARERGLKPVPAAVVKGGLATHHIGVNDTGIQFKRAARARAGDDPDAVGWSNEAPLNASNGYGRVVPDALLHYEVGRNGAGPLLLTIAIELDRATTPVQRLVNKVLAYSRLRANPDAWERRFAVWPLLVVVFAGKPRPHLERRMATVVSALKNDPRTRDIELGPTLFGLFDDLTATGPFSPIFRSIEGDRPVNVLGA